VQLVTRGHFRSRDKDGDRTNRSVIAKHPMVRANFMALFFIEPQVWVIEVLHCGNKDFVLFDPDDLTIQT